MKTHWATSARQYLARRDAVFLQHAIDEAHDKQLVAVLSAHQRGDSVAVHDLAPAIHDRLAREGRTEDATTVALLHIDVWARGVEEYVRLPLDRQQEILGTGLAYCHLGVVLSTQLNDLPCLGFYLFEQAK